MPLIACLGVINGLLYAALWWKIDEYKIGFHEAENHSYYADVLGFCFLIMMDQIVETSFGQIILIPNVFAVFKREVSNNMYKPAPFYVSRIIAAMLLYIFYPFAVTMTVIWCLGLPVMGFAGWVSFWSILTLTAFVGSMLGLCIGACFPNQFQALTVNIMVFILISLGGGLSVNTGAGANIFVRFIFWISPMHYSVELMMRRMLEGRRKHFSDKALEALGFTDDISTCVLILIGFYFLFVTIGLVAVHRLAKQ